MTKTVCIMLVMALVGSLTAQEKKDGSTIFYLNEELTVLSTTDVDLSESVIPQQNDSFARLGLLTNGNIAYGNVLAGTPRQYVKWDVENPASTLTTVGDFFANFHGADFFDGFLYGYLTNGTFLKIDGETGIILEQIVGAAPKQLQDMAYDYSQDVMYGIVDNTLVTVDLTTGARNVLASITNLIEGRTLLTLACALDGTLYAIESCNVTGESARFLSIDKVSGEATFVGFTGMLMNFVQSMGFDHNTETLYWANYASSNYGNFMWIDTETGEANLISPMLLEISGLHIPYYTTEACPEISDLEANVDPTTNNVLLTWTATPGDPLYIIYEDFEEVATTNENQFLLVSQNPGIHKYSVAASYGEDCRPIKVRVTVDLDFTGNEVLAYGNIVIGTPTNYARWDVTYPAYRQPVATNFSNVYGGEYFGGRLFAFRNTGSFLIINAETGAILEEIPEAWTNQMNDMAFDYSQNIMYGMYNKNLYTVDLWKGEVTFVAPITGVDDDILVFTLAIDTAGNMYGIKGTTSQAILISIDKTTGASIEIGATGKGINFGQSMGFDHNNGILYWAHYVSATDANFMSINTETGEATLIYPTRNEVTMLHIPYNDANTCPTVTDLMATVQANNVDVLLTWTAVSGAAGYRVYSETFQKMVTTTATQFLMELQPPGLTNYWVEAILPDGCNPNRVIVSVMVPPGDHNPPRNFKAVHNENCKVKLTWSVPFADPDDATNVPISYSVYCNDALVQTVPHPYTLLDYTIPDTGEFEFSVSANYTHGTPSMKIFRTVEASCEIINDMNVKYLSSEMNYDAREVKLSWLPPTKMQWDNTDVAITASGSSVGYWGGEQMGGQVFAADDFYAYEQFAVGKVSIRVSYNAVFGEFAQPNKFYVGIFTNVIGDIYNSQLQVIGQRNLPNEEIYRDTDITSFVQNIITVVGTTVTSVYEVYLPEPFTLPAAGTYWLAMSASYDENLNDNNNRHRMSVLMGYGGIGYNFTFKDEDGLLNASYPQSTTWIPFVDLFNLTHSSLWFTVENVPAVKYNVYMDGELFEGGITETSLTVAGVDISIDHLFTVTVVDENNLEGDGESVTTDGYICNRVGSSASAVINDELTEAVITWPAAVGANTLSYRIVYNDEILADSIYAATAAERRYEHRMTFESGKTYEWEIYTLCGETYSDPRVVVATVPCICNTVSNASAEINEELTEAVITWSEAVGENTKGYRIVFNDEIIADDLSATDRSFVHIMTFEAGKTYEWEIYTFCCEATYSDPRVAEFTTTPFICNTVDSSASAVINDELTEAVITWPAADGENVTGYRIVYNDEIISDNIPNTPDGRRFVHDMKFEYETTYQWEIYTICGEKYSDPRIVQFTTPKDPGGAIKLNLFGLLMYPNPASNSVIIEGVEIVKVEIYNILGYLIDIKEGRIKEVDVSAYKQGQYIFKVFDANNNFVNKLITVKK